MTTETIQTLIDHVTVRDFADKPLDDETVLTLLRAARRSPTSSNMQTYSMVVVRDQSVKQQLADLAGGQKHIITCPVFVALCADTNRLRQVCEYHDTTPTSGLELTMIATIDASLVGMSLTSAAESMGLGAVMIGGMRNDPVRAAKLLGLPPGVFVTYGLCLGWPASRPQQKPRLPEEMVIHFEQYNNADAHDLIKEHNAEMAEHYRSLGRETPDDAFSQPIANRVSKPVRTHLRSALESLGLGFD